MAEKAVGYDISLPDPKTTGGALATEAVLRATSREVLADHGRAEASADV